MAQGQVGLAREGFDLDLQHGQAHEHAFGHLLLEARCDRIRIEHKCDGKAKLTKNVFVEFKQKGRPSGLSVSTAEFWAIEYDFEHWIVLPSGSLKNLARKYLEIPGHRVMGGDFKLYEGVLIPLKAFVELNRPGPTQKDLAL